LNFDLVLKNLNLPCEIFLIYLKISKENPRKLISGFAQDILGCFWNRISWELMLNNPGKNSREIQSRNSWDILRKKSQDIS
jgi:hypothetical protein